MCMASKPPFPPIEREDSRIWLNLVRVMLFLALIGCVLMPGMTFVLLLDNQCSALEAPSNISLPAQVDASNTTQYLLLAVFVIALALAVGGLYAIYRQRGKL